MAIWNSGLLPALAAVIALAASPAASSPTGSPAIVPEGSSRVLVGYTSEGMAGAASLEQAVGGRLVASIAQLDVHVLELADARLAGALTALRSDPRVRYVQLDGRVWAFRIPHDEFWSSQWSPVKTEAPQGWDLTTGSSQVVVAVLDTGVDPHQADLAGKLVPGYDYVSSDANPEDDNGHGTAVAGIIAANSDNKVGVAGYCWHCRLMPVKVLGADGTGSTSALAMGIVWATDNGARVINLSLGGPTEDLTVASAAQYARLHGALVVAAAGNESSSTPAYPAALSGVLSVAASDQHDRLYSFSNSGASLAAPGENSTTAAGGGYATFLGTSSAAPVVSGIAGLAFSIAPEATPAQVEQALEASAVHVDGVVYGRVDAFRTLQAFAPPVSPSPVPEGDATPKAGRASGPRSSAGAQTGARETRRFAGTLSGSSGARSFPLTAAAGVLRATLTLSKRVTVPVRLQLVAEDGSVVASARGTRVLRLRARVRAVPYRLVVRHSGKSAPSFKLAVSYPRALTA